MLEFGKGVPKDTDGAVRLYRMAAEKMHAKSIAYLAVLMMKGEIMERNTRGAEALFDFVAENGFAPLAADHMMKVGVSLLKKSGASGPDAQLGLKLLRKAEALGNEQAKDIMTHLRS